MIGAPKITVGRSAFMQFVDKPTSFKHGQLVPIDSTIVQPGDTLKCDLGSHIIMNTPVQPFTGEIECEINAFFVPLRLLWSKWKQFWGENENSAGVPTPVSIQLRNSDDSDIFHNGVPWSSVCAYVGKPLVVGNSSKHCLLTLWKEKAYYKVWSEHYRSSMLQNPFIMSDYVYQIGSLNGVRVNTSSPLLNVNKSVDLFTAATDSPQFGSSVTLPLGQTAPVISATSMHEMGTAGILLGYDKNTPAQGMLELSGGKVSTETHTPGTLSTPLASNLEVDLSAATAATVNTLRFAIATQRYQEASIYGGAYYWGQLMAHFGVTPADASLQRSERLGTINFRLNVSQVTAMGNTTINGQTAPAGSLGAVSVTGNSRHLFTKAFTEHGVVLVLLHTRVKNQTYCQGVLREDTKTERIDYYSNEYAHIGNVAIAKKEIFVTGDATDEEPFGYQEAWYENRYRNSAPSGVLNPNAGAGVAVDVYTLANNFGSRPTLGAAFITEDRANVASRLVTGTSSNYDYVGFFKFAYDKITETPLHSVPGLMDHLGNM